MLKYIYSFLIFFLFSLIFLFADFIQAPGFNDGIASTISQASDIFSNYSHVLVTKDYITCAQEFSGFELSDSAHLDKADVPMMIPNDFDGDGNLDIIASTYGHTIKFIRNDGTGDFSTYKTFSSSLDPGGSGHITGGDFNGDGKVDLIVLRNNESGHSGWVGVYINNGDYSFTVTPLPNVRSKIANHNQYWTAHMLDIGDIDGDGKLDFVAATTKGKIYYVKGKVSEDGSFEFEDKARLLLYDNCFKSGHNGAMVVATGDIDGDGDIDLVASSTQKKTIKVYYNDGNGHFNDSRTIVNSSGEPVEGNTLEDTDGNSKNYVGGATAIDLKDIDGNGSPDIVIGTDRWKSGKRSRLYAFLNNGDGTFSGTDYGQVNTGSNGDIDGGSIGDFNNDGKIDVVLIDGNDDGSIALYKNDTEDLFVDDNDFGQSYDLITVNPGSKSFDYDNFDSNIYSIESVRIDITLQDSLPDGSDVTLDIATEKDGSGNWIFKPASKISSGFSYSFSLSNLGGSSIVYKLHLKPSSDRMEAPKITKIEVFYSVKSSNINIEKWKIIR